MEESLIAEQSELVQRFVESRQRLFGFVLTLTHDYHLAEELVQELSLQIIDEASRGVSPDNVFAWLLGMARHRVADHYRKCARDQREMQRLAELADVAAQAFIEHETLFDTDVIDRRIEHLRACLEKLTARTRSLLNARYERSQKIEQIAFAMEWKAASVKVALAKARKSLAECVERKFRNGGAA